ncbi:microtubule associated protein-domain-containing protein [Lineolata rhizophorae]|uniref:Microtubule associated protein-domain-containing protein n=1 Tax=Lineolata rhizophorae TaxID=578093 RepID=A0A6A6NP41_9PEZI|nr:microtubule associated protein-domain-containing protein [Lineolata rhizophorae]
MDTSYLAQQVTTIIGQLHGLFDEIGIASHERDSREAELFSALSETLHNQLRAVTTEKHELTEEANRLIKTIKQMEASLDGTKQSDAYSLGDDELKVTIPLLRCIQTLREKYNIVSKLHRERFEQIKKLAVALESYASHLESSFVQVKLPPTSPNAAISPSFDLSPAYVNSLDNEFTRVYNEYTRRVETVRVLADEVIKLWAELGTPQAQTDHTIVECARDAPEQLGLHKDDLARLRERRDKLVDEKKGRERRIKELRNAVEELWERLGMEEADRKAFLAGNRGCGLRAINEFEDELARLNELKRQNLHLFVEEARCRLQELWDTLYFSEEEMLDFTPAFSDVYSDALLSAHEAEIDRLENLKHQRLPVLALIDKHRALIKERDDLAASAADPSRLIAKKGERRDPTRLLREEKMRKRIAKELPKVGQDLQRALESWEDEYGRPFLVHGERYLDELYAAQASGKQAPPARSKTPSAMPPPAKPGAKAAPQNSRAGATSAMRGPPPTRSKTPTAGISRATPLPASSSHSHSTVSAARSGAHSPSKIPARVPLSHMPHGSNSPERKAMRGGHQGGASNSKTMPPPPGRAPPPKMKDFFSPPPSASSEEHNPLSGGGIVRQVAPEDPYQDRERDYFDAHAGAGQHSYMQSSAAPNRSGMQLSRSEYPMAPASRAGSAMAQHPHSQSAYGHQASSSHGGSGSGSCGSGSVVPGSRQISGSSAGTATTGTTANTVSGSENWETYDDGSDAEPEPEADAYYAQLRAARAAAKRATPDGGFNVSGAGKKIRSVGLGVRGADGEVFVEGEGGEMVRVGSDGGWTDDMEAY